MEPTLRPAHHFDPLADCERLRKAMKGLGTDEAAIISIMAHRSVDQRCKIVSQFQKSFGRSLLREFKSELKGHLLQVMTNLCYPIDEFLARELHQAMAGAGTKASRLIEILATQTNAGMASIRESYKEVFDGADLEKDITKETSGHFQNVLIGLVQGRREESTTIDANTVKEDATKLFDAGENNIGTDESTFNKILVSRSYAHLRAVFEEYEKISGNEIEAAIDRQTKGDLEDSFLAIVHCIKNMPLYFANQMYKAMKGMGTRDTDLMRVIIWRCEIDMGNIKTEYAKSLGKNLDEAVKDDTTGDYRKTLLALLGC